MAPSGRRPLWLIGRDECAFPMARLPLGSVTSIKSLRAAVRLSPSVTKVATNVTQQHLFQDPEDF
jgi:hypothetical protein